MEREEKWVIPFIKKEGEEAGEDIAILCAPWSPPAFMKNNKDMNHGGRLLRKYYGAWKHGETYGHNMINDFNNYTEGWVDWNLILDETGGPNYAGNFCEAPIMIDTKENKVNYNISYYYIGHFSRYIKSGAKRILCLNDSDKGVYSVSYKNPDGQIIVVVQNELSKRNRLAIAVDGKGINTEVPPHSITTFIVTK